MKKILIILLLLPLLSTGQTDTLKKKKTEIGISFSPDIAYRSLKPDGSSSYIADIRDTLEIPKFGYTAGLNVGYTLSKKLSIEAAVLFSDRGERTEKYTTDAAITGQATTKYAYNFHYYYLGIPLKADYFLITKKLRLYITAGISADFFLGETVSAITYTGNERTKENTFADPGFSKVNIGMLAGAGIRYPVGKRSEFFAEPVYRRSLTSITIAPVKSYLYSGGLTLGLYYNL